MNNTYHILNGDSLKEQFPESISGTIYVARECLIDGDIAGKTLQALYATRAAFISSAYGGTEKEYYSKVVPQFEAISAIPTGSDINLWFEDDLFCQINFWFVLHILAESNFDGSIYLIRPEVHTMYGFAGLNKEELVEAYNGKLQITDSEFKTLSNLWGHYQLGEYAKMKDLSNSVDAKYPFLLNAIEAHIERIPSDGDPGRPKRVLKEIMTDLNTTKFGPVFGEFCKREAIYGFGDLQVKRLFDEVIEGAG